MAEESVAHGRGPMRLPSVRLGFPKQLEILRAFAVLSGNGSTAVHYTKVAETIQAHESNVSMMNPFFVENGFIIKSGTGHLPSIEVLEFSRKWSWNRETAGAALAPLLKRSWFGELLLRRLMFRALSEDEAVEVLASTCGAEPNARPQLRMLLDYLQVAGLVRRENGQLALTGQVPGVEKKDPPAEALPKNPAQGASAVTGMAAGVGNINFQVSVNVNMTDLAGWSADRIAAFFSGMAQVIAAQNKEGPEPNESA